MENRNEISKWYGVGRRKELRRKSREKISLYAFRYLEVKSTLLIGVAKTNSQLVLSYAGDKRKEEEEERERKKIKGEKKINCFSKIFRGLSPVFSYCAVRRLYTNKSSSQLAKRVYESSLILCTYGGKGKVRMESSPLEWKWFRVEFSQRMHGSG